MMRITSYFWEEGYVLGAFICLAVCLSVYMHIHCVAEHTILGFVISLVGGGGGGGGGGGTVSITLTGWEQNKGDCRVLIPFHFQNIFNIPCERYCV